MLIIKGLNFVLTSSACPEQYEVYDYDNRHVGYVRLRFGRLTCEFPDVGGELIYSVNTAEDGYTGTFEDVTKRYIHLNLIADAIIEKIKEKEFNSKSVENQGYFPIRIKNPYKNGNKSITDIKLSFKEKIQILFSKGISVEFFEYL